MAKQPKKKTIGKQKAPTPPPSRWAVHRPLFERIFFVVALMGVLVTAHFNLTASTGFEQECLFGAFETPTAVSGCEAALESAVGRPLGVSNAVWGMLFYLVVAGLCAAIVFGAAAWRLLLKRARAALVGLGFFYSMFLTAYQFVAMPTRCPLCLISALLVTVLLGVQVLYLVQPVDLSTMTMKAKKKVREGALYGALAVMMLLFVGADAAYFSNLTEPAADQKAQTAPTAQAAPTPVTQPVAAPDEAGPSENECLYDPNKPSVVNFEALVGPKDPYQGNPDAAVTVVEFFDPNCPHCKALHPVMKATIAKYEDRARFVYKPIWLPQFPFSVQQNAVLFAAAEQGKFSEMLDLQFKWQQRGGLTTAQLQELATQIGMTDADAMLKRIEEGQYDDMIMEGNKQAVGAGVTGVPAVIINGRFVARSSRTEACLGQLIEEELQGVKAEG